MKNYLLIGIMCAAAVSTQGAGNRQVLQRQNLALEAQKTQLEKQLNALNQTTTQLLTGATTPGLVGALNAQTARVTASTATAQGIQAQIQGIITKLGALGGLSDAQAQTFGYMIKYLNQIAAERSIFQANAVAFLAAPRLVTNPANLTLKTADIKATPQVTNTASSTPPETRENSAKKAATSKTTDEVAALTLVQDLRTKLSASANFTTYEADWFDATRPLHMGTGTPTPTATSTPSTFDFVQHLGSMKSDYEAAMKDPTVATDATNQAVGLAIDAALAAYKALVMHEARTPQTVAFDQQNYFAGNNKAETKGTPLTLIDVAHPANYDAYWKEVEAVRASYELALSLYIERFTQALSEELDPKTCTKLNNAKTGFEPNIELLLHLNGLICDAVTDLVWFDLDSIDRLMADYADGANRHLIAEAVTTELNKRMTGGTPPTLAPATGEITPEIIAAMANVSAAMAASGTTGIATADAAVKKVAAVGTSTPLAADQATAAATDANIAAAATDAETAATNASTSTANVFDFAPASASVTGKAPWPTGATCVLSTYRVAPAGTPVVKNWTFWHSYDNGANVDALDRNATDGFGDQLTAIAAKKGHFATHYP